MAMLLIRRLIAGRSFAVVHFGTTIPLYLWVIGSLAMVLTHAKPNLAGGDIALRISIFIAAYGIIINAVWVALRRDRRYRNSTTFRHSRSRFIR